MDAVELPYPLDVAAAAAPKLGGSVTVKELEACDSDRVSVVVSPSSIECCSSFRSEKAAGHAIGTSESASWGKILDSGACTQEKQLPRNQVESLAGVVHERCKNALLLTPKVEGVQLERKAGKTSRSSSLCSKRPRVIQLREPPIAGVDGIKDVSQKLGSCSLKCTSSSSEKTQLVKQKNHCSKRADKRSLRVPVKTKHHSFSVKSGLINFGLAAGGNNFFGVYGLKSDTHDVTKLVEDHPLNELLCGNFESPSLGKDKGKKAVTGTDSFLHSVHKACSTLQLPRSVQSQTNAEADSCLNKKMSPWLLSSVSIEPSGVNGDTGDSSTIDMSSSEKDTSIKSETPANLLDFPLYKPLDILQRLQLPPPKDLESLLLDAAKPALSSKNTPDMRSGKQITRRVSLPPFPWSHTSSSHCRTGSDVVKLTTSKGTCQGRWQRIAKSVTSSLDIATGNFMELESLTYDRSLVPSELKIASLDNEISPQISSSLSGRALEIVAPSSKGPFVTLESGGKRNHPGNDDHCPKLLAAAQTLYDIATHPLRQNLERLLRWPKKSSQKAMKARKLKSNERSEEPHVTTVSLPRSENLARSERIIPSKKPKLSHINNKKDFNHIRREAVNWSTPRSSRSSPGKTFKDSVAADMRHTTANIVKQSYMMPPPLPPVRVSENASNGQQKLRKLMPFEWNR